ncbi:hypothetical protein PP613_23370 [Mycobacteroides abscessus]|nr:hypothetical protein [Mycobacteroides abscessus]MDM2412283.1 hypothetical protein [Mycobacteroides abscessus]
MNLEFDHHIAERVLESGRGTQVTVKLGAPHPFDGHDPGQGWYCPFRVEGINDQPWASFAGGVDSVQALMLALARIGDFLNSHADLELTFAGQQDLGFLNAGLFTARKAGEQ